MQHSHTASMVRNTSATSTKSAFNNSAGSDKLFQLECVLLFALDVVKGPYIHSCAPAHPPEAIRSFLQFQTAPASSSAVTTSLAAGSSAARRGTLPPPSPPVPLKVSAAMLGGDNTAMSPAGSHSAAAAAAAAASPNASEGSAAMRGSPSRGAFSAGRGGGGLAVGSLSSSFVSEPPPPTPSVPSRTPPQTAAVGASLLAEPCLPQHAARTPLLGQQPRSPQSIAFRTNAAAGLAEPALGGAACGNQPSMFSLVAQRRLVGLSDPTTADKARSYAMGDNKTFALSSHVSQCESQPTLPSPSPTVDSFALTATRSLGSGDALALGTSPGENGDESTHANGEHRCDACIEAARAMEWRTGMDDGTSCTDKIATPATTVDGHSTNSSSMTAACASTRPVAAAPPCAGGNGSEAALGAASERHSTTDRQRQLQHRQHLLPSSPQVWPSLASSTTTAARGAPSSATSATAAAAAADNGRMSGYNDVFVPRSEFCRRVLWLYPAESGLLFLYYPEDIPGEHYQRKTLRYSLCLVFRVDHKQVTIGDGLLHQLVHPYSVVLTNIAEELREAEIKYSYMIRGLCASDSAPWQMSSPALTSPMPSLSTSATAALHVAAPSLVTASMAGAAVIAVSDDFEERAGQAHLPTAPAPPPSTLQKPHTPIRGRVAGQGSAIGPSSAVATAAAMTGTDALSTPSSSSAHADLHPLSFAELGGTEAIAAAAAACKSDRLHSAVEVADRTPTLFVPPRQSSIASLGEETEGCGSTEATLATVSRGCSSQLFEEGVGGAQSRCDGIGGSLPTGMRGFGDSSSLATRTAAVLAAAHTGTSVPLPTIAHSCSSSTSTTAFVVEAGSLGTGGGACASSVRSSLMHPNAGAVDIAITSPSSLPPRSRTMSEAAAAFQPLAAQVSGLDEPMSTASSSAATLFSFGHAAAPASAFSAALGSSGSPPYHSGIRQQYHQNYTAGANAATSPRVSSPYHGMAATTAAASMGGSAAAGSGMHILNAFITPPTAPQWTPLSELVEELFRCLSYTSEAPDGSGDRERDGQMGSPATGGRSPLTASPSFSGAAAELVAQQSEDALTAGIDSKALAQPPTPLTPALPAGQQQRGDTSVVHLSNRLSFHVRRMAPLQPARLLHFDHVPVPIVAYNPAMMEWMDMAVHHVFQLVNGVRTVADLVFDVAMGTTTTLAEVYTDALQRSASEWRDAAALRAPTSPPSGATASSAPRSAAANRDRVRGAAGRGAAPLSVSGAAASAAEAHGSGESAAEAAVAAARGTGVVWSPSQPVLVSVPIDVRPRPFLPPGVRCSIPTSAAGPIGDGQAPLPSQVNVRVTPATASGASIPSAGVSVRSVASSVTPTVPIAPGTPDTSSGATTSAFLPPPPHISMELPQTWVATTGIVMEALLHLELCHLIKVYRPWTERTLYSITRSAQRVLRRAHHPARHVLAHYLLCMAWAERQERSEQRRRVMAEWKHMQKESLKEKRQARRASKTSGVPTPAFAEKQHASTPMGIVSPRQRSSTAAACPSSAAPRSFTAPTAALAITPAGGIGTKITAANAAVSSRSPNQLIDRSEWLPAATLQLSSSVPCVSDVPHSGRDWQQPHQTPLLGSASYPESSAALHSPHTDTQLMSSGGGGAIHVGGPDSGSNGTQTSSSVATSFAPSSLRHSLSFGASGRLQMTLTSSLPTLPLLISGASAGAAAGGTSQRLFFGSQSSQTSGGELLLCAAAGPSCGSSPLQQQQHQSPHQYPHAHRCLRAASLRSCSSTSISNSANTSSKDSCASTSHKSSSSALSSVSSESGSSSVSSSSSSAASPMPMLPPGTQQLAGLSVADASAAHTSAVPARVEVPVMSSPTASAAGSNAPARASKGTTAVDTVAGTAQRPLNSLSGDNTAKQRPTAKPTAASALGVAERQATIVAAAEASQRGARRRRCPPLKVFAPTEADMSQAAAAALCALAKFNNASVSSVQEEMRRIPVWASSFNHWSDRCVKALVEVALLNNWLEDVSQ
ncbi:hypothetical protein LSCM4_01841 [Leishmania orientalis]|uniref:Uncharacterized protein n=1 Tax=Leishmania orientalis TaxID=2249476 RepID=A0A836H7Z4_9TRYP|nr:hypothetical protein LSCM4_01841 [Leishmania orientalis]